MSFQLAGMPLWQRQNRLNWIFASFIAFLLIMIVLLYARLGEWRAETQANAVYNEQTAAEYVQMSKEYREMIRLHKQRDSIEVANGTKNKR